MRYVVLGGGGFMGSHLAALLVSQGHSVVVFDRPEARWLSVCAQSGASIVTGDFLNRAEVGRALTDCDVLFHLVSATVPQTANEDPLHDFEANVLGSLRLLEEAHRAGVGRIVFASSGGTVYGVAEQLPITEAHPTQPVSSYGVSKLMIEKLLHLYMALHGMDYRILRVANSYGERQPSSGPQGVVGAFVSRILSSQPLEVWGDGSVVRDYIYVGDVARAFASAAAHEGDQRVFNIGTGRGHSLREVIETIGEITGRTPQVRYAAPRNFDVPANVLDITRARTGLGWEPEVELRPGLERVVDWISRGEAAR